MKSGSMDGLRLRAALLQFAFVAMGAFLLAPAARADDAGPAARAVRLGFVEGRVQISQDGQVLADPAVANAPLFEGTQVTTLEDGQAEIQFEDGSVARLSPNSSITLSILNQQNGTSETEIVVQSGLAYFELQAGDAGQVRVRFGQSIVTPSGFTVLRIGLDNPPGGVAVFSGNAHIDRGDAPALDLHGGESVSFQNATPTGYDLAESIEPDSWDAWNEDRDQALQAESAQKTGATKSFSDSSNPAWADLDAGGNWYNVPDQGYVWSPNDAAAPGWDPYGNGNWMWTPRFGYIWVSGDPWGYLPFQCGTWDYFDAFGWGWSPGPGMCRPWWRRGRWFMNIGFAPGGYRYPLRPIPRRRATNPRPGGVKLASHPLIAVNHRPPSGSGGLPVRGRNTPVVIAGHTVQPLRPLPPRQQYDRAGNGFLNRSQSVYQGARTPATQGRPNGSTTGGSHPGYSPAPRPSGGSSPHVSAPSHSSGGYSGGGSSHVSSGGGSAGGGGGSHAGGGGGNGGGSHH